MAIYSYSRLSTFEQCQLKFKFKYHDCIEPDFEDTIESFLGKKVHETLQWIYNNNKGLNSPELDQVISYFINSWNNDFNEEIKIVNSSSRSLEYYFNKGIRLIINYFTKNYPFKDNTIALEKKIYINLDSDKKLIGYIDRLVKNENIFEIHDYKTGYIKSVEQLNNDTQLALYSIAIRDSFENVEEIFLVWHFLNYNKEVRLKIALEELDKVKKNTIELITKIETTKDFKPNPGNLCNWCEFQSKCPAFKEYKEKKY